MTTEKQRKAIIEALRQQTEIDTRSKEAALASLIRQGFLTPDGRLAPEYGGEGADEDSVRF